MNQPELYPNWLVNATPGTTDKNGHFTPESCYRYRLNNSQSLQLHDNFSSATECPRELFNRSIKERCFDWVFDNEEKTIVQEVSELYNHLIKVLKA